MKLVITVSGLHGTGKSTYAKALAKNFKLRHISAGQLFRKIAEEREVSIEELSKIAKHNPEVDRTVDDRTKQQVEAGNVVIDGQLAGWMAGDKGNVKIFLTAPEKTRFKRIAKRDRISYAEAEERTRLRETIESERYKKLYGIDIDDYSIYSLIVDTNLLSLNKTIKILKNVVTNYIADKG